MNVEYYNLNLRTNPSEAISLVVFGIHALGDFFFAGMYDLAAKGAGNG